MKPGEGLKRLAKLANYLHRLDGKIAEHFDMNDWFQHYGDQEFGKEHKVRKGASLSAKDLRTCSTAACALGWACTLPSFQKLGLQLKYLGENGAEIRFKSMRGNELEIARKFFDLMEDEADQLFCPCAGDETPQDWAERCREFIAERKAA